MATDRPRGGTRARSPAGAGARRRAGIVPIAFVVALLAALVVVRIAHAHTAGVSRCDLTYGADGDVQGLLVFSKLDAARIAGALARGRGVDDRGGAEGDASAGDDAGNAEELAFRRFVARGLVVHADDVACPGGVQGGGDVEGDGFGLALRYRCPAGAKVLRADLLFEVELPAGHRTFASLAAGSATAERTLGVDERTITLAIPSTQGAPPRASPPPSASGEGTFVGAVRLGVAHILGGWDHLLFLVALVLGVREGRRLAWSVTAFTAAHSITLACAALGVFAPSPRIVEPLVALSIAAVALGSALHETPRHPARVTFAFGLAHGLAFASALAGLALDRARLLPSLFGFNLGVEVGQLGVVAIVYPLFAWLRRRGTASPPRVRAVAWGLVVTGVVVAVARAAQP